MATVTTSPLVKTYTLEEFWELPDPPGREKMELIAGVLYMTPPPNAEHDHVFNVLNRTIAVFLEGTSDAGMLFAPRAAIWTGPATHVEPDLMYVSAALAGKMDPNQRSSADLVVEILSPGTEVYDRTTKADTYGALGVRELWLVDPTSQSVEVVAWKVDGEISRHTYSSEATLSSTVLEGFSLPIKRIWT